MAILSQMIVQIRCELANFQPDPGDAAWLRGQIRFLREHRSWASSARKLRDTGKRGNLAGLECLLALCQS
jgi:hypothetical protein